jgi:hypothetical protein
VARPKQAAPKVADDAEGGERARAEGGGSVPLIDVVVETVCTCNDFADDGVQLQVIKALLTAITSDHCASQAPLPFTTGARAVAGLRRGGRPMDVRWVM